MSNTQKQTTVLAWVTSALVLAITAISFVISYNALRDMNQRYGISGQLWGLDLSYLWPLLIDFSLLVFSLCVVTAHLYGDSTRRQWSLVAIYTMTTIAVNTLHVWPELVPIMAIKITIACIPPVSLFFSFETLMGQLKASIKRQQQQATIAGYDTALQIAQRGFNDLMAQVETIKAEYQADIAKRDNQLAELNTRLEIALDPVGTRRKAIVHTLQIDPMTTYKVLADEHKVSTQTIQNDLVKMTEAGAIHRNGLGWEVLR